MHFTSMVGVESERWTWEGFSPLASPTTVRISQVPFSFLIRQTVQITEQDLAGEYKVFVKLFILLWSYPSLSFSFDAVVPTGTLHLEPPLYFDHTQLKSILLWEGLGYKLYDE
jgi:hypothetical protein